MSDTPGPTRILVAEDDPALLNAIKARVASRLLECAAKGDVSVEALRAAGRCALEGARAT